MKQAPESKNSLVIFEICELPVDSICMISLEFLPFNQEPDRSNFFSNIFLIWNSKNSFDFWKMIYLEFS